MSGSRKRRLHLVNALGLAAVAATCFLAACSDSDGGSDDPSKAGSGSGGKASAGGAGKGGSASAGKGGSSAGAGDAGEENVAGDSGDGGDGGEAGSEAGGAGGSIGGAGGSGGSAGGSIVGTGGTAGTGGSGGAAVVLTPNCVRDTTSGHKVEISTTGNDGLFAAAYGPDGKLYAAGYVQNGVAATEDRQTVVVRLTAAGALDTTWGTNGSGIVKVNVVATADGIPGQGELPRGLAFQGDKILVAGTVEASATAAAPQGADRNVYVFRLLADGTLDLTFGDNSSGIHTLPLSTGVLNTAGTGISGADQQWGLNVLSDNKIIVTAATRAAGFQSADPTLPRTDTDFAVIKLTADGAQDATFGLVGGTPGVYTLDIAQANASVRTASVVEDNKLIITGYSTYGGSQRPVIFKLLANGSALDTSFASAGIFSEPVGTAAEAYGALVQTGGKLVTVGYGRATSANTTSDILSIRLTAGGVLDTTYGATGTTTPGRTWFDVGGLGDNGRAIVLSDDRPVLFGGGSLSTGQQDAVIALLSIDGAPLTTFGSPYGCTAYDFGSVGDFFWAGAVNTADAGKIAAVGLTGHASGSTEDTDGIVVLINKP